MAILTVSGTHWTLACSKHFTSIRTTSCSPGLLCVASSPFSSSAHGLRRCSWLFQGVRKSLNGSTKSHSHTRKSVWRVVRSTRTYGIISYVCTTIHCVTLTHMTRLDRRGRCKKSRSGAGQGRRIHSCHRWLGHDLYSPVPTVVPFDEEPRMPRKAVR